MSRTRLPGLLTFTAALLLSAVTLGCSEEKSQEEKMKEAFEQMGKRMAEAFKNGGEVAAELKTKPDFEKDLSSKEYPAATTPEGKQKFNWDFSKKHKYIYDYSQKMKMASSMGIGQDVNATAKLTVKAKGDKTADVILNEFDAESSIMGGVSMPAQAYQGMTEDSNIPGAAASQDEMIRLLFPLPAKALLVGESDAVPGKMPFNAMGSLLWVKGETKLTLKEYVTVGGHTCARFDVDIDISKMDVPEELTGEYKCSMKGRGAVYYDVEDRCLHSAQMAIVMSMRVAAGEESALGAMPMAMDMDTLMVFSRNMEKEEEANRD
jgi:hypothetical protein